MKTMFKLEGTRVVVDPEVRLIKEFKALYAADKDSKKVKATAWFGYIFFMYDVRSPYMTLEEVERGMRVERDLKLTNFKVSPTLKAAIAKYKELSETPSTLALSETRDTMLVSAQVMGTVRDELKKLIKGAKENDHDQHLDVEEILKQLKALMDMSKQYPGIIKELKNLEDEVKKEQASGMKIKGGGTVGSYED